MYPPIHNYMPDQIQQFEQQHRFSNFQILDKLLTSNDSHRLKSLLLSIGKISSPYQAADYLGQLFYFKGAEILNQRQEDEARRVYGLLPETERCMLRLLFVMTTYFSSKTEIQLRELLKLFYENILAYMHSVESFPRYSPLIFPNGQQFATPFAAIHLLRDYLTQLNEQDFGQRIKHYVTFETNRNYLDYNAIKTSLVSGLFRQTLTINLQKIWQSAGYRLNEVSYAFSGVPNFHAPVRLQIFALDIAMLGRNSLQQRNDSIRAYATLMPQSRPRSFSDARETPSRGCWSCCVVS
jgi:hypothetical protein